MSELIAQILCAVSDCENKCGVKQKTLFVAFTATPFEQWLAAVAARVPSSNRHIPFISRLRISVRLGCGASPPEIINY